MTRKALLLARSFSPEKLEFAHEACYSGRYGRLGPAVAGSAVERHRRHFRLNTPVAFRARPMGRIVVAKRFGRGGVQNFGQLSWDAVVALRAVGREGRLIRGIDPPVRMISSPMLRGWSLEMRTPRRHRSWEKLP